MHSSRAESLYAQHSASPDAWELTFRQMVMFDLAKDMELGNFLSYYRNFAVPQLAETLVVNGEIIERPTTRPSSSTSSSPTAWTAPVDRKWLPS